MANHRSALPFVLLLLALSATEVSYAWRGFELIFFIFIITGCTLVIFITMFTTTKVTKLTKSLLFMTIFTTTKVTSLRLLANLANAGGVGLGNCPRSCFATCVRFHFLGNIIFNKTNNYNESL